MQTITFSERALGTVDPVYLAKINTIWFEGTIVADGPHQPSLAPTAALNGMVTVHFNALVSSISFDGGNFNQIGSTIVKYYDRFGHVLATFDNDRTGIEHFTYSNDVGIAKMTVASITDEFSIDSLSFATISKKVFASGDDDIDGLLWGFRWDHKVLTYSFPTGKQDYLQSGYYGVQGFEALNPAQIAAYAKILNDVGNVCGLRFVPTNQPAADLRFAEADGINEADGYGMHMPGWGTAQGTPTDPDYSTGAWGDAWFTHGYYNAPRLGSFAYAAGLMHELGHTLGLKHGHAVQMGHGYLFPTLPADHDSYEYSIMTYRQYPGADTTSGDNAPDHPTTFMQDDIAALQYMYGADYGRGSNNRATVYLWDTRTGEEFIDGVGQGTTLHGKIFLTVWDGGGYDTYDFSNYRTALSIDLQPGAWTGLGRQVANLGDGHVARGNIANALLYHNNPASLIEAAIGGSGRDTIIGNQKANFLAGHGRADQISGLDGRDTIDGGGGHDIVLTGNGRDVVVFASRLAGNLDTIVDFSVANDTIRLDKSFFPGLAGTGVLHAANFRSGSTAFTPDEHIVCDPSTGAVYFDANGSNPGGATQFAQLSAGLAITSFDFVVTA